MKQISLPAERKVYCKFMIALIRLLTAWRQVPAVGGMDSILILSAIVLGAIEGKPFKSVKLSEYLGIPRTTLLRRVEELIADGYVEITPTGAYWPGPKVLSNEVKPVLASLKGMILGAADELRGCNSHGRKVAINMSKVDMKTLDEES